MANKRRSCCHWWCEKRLGNAIQVITSKRCICCHWRLCIKWLGDAIEFKSTNTCENGESCLRKTIITCKLRLLEVLFCIFQLSTAVRELKIKLKEICFFIIPKLKMIIIQTDVPIKRKLISTFKCCDWFSMIINSVYFVSL